MIRVTAGSLRGRRIPVPRGEVRPTSERARQAYFDIVGDRIHGARFLDLFAGSGVFSFEAVSRGALEAVAVDDSRDVTRQIDRMAAEFSVPVRTVTAEALGGIKRLGTDGFHLLYADPPYEYASHRDLLEAIDAALPLCPGALVAIEHRRRSTHFPSGEDDSWNLKRLTHWRRAEYGEVWITFFIA